MNTDFILDKLKEHEKFRLIFAKNAVLQEAVWALQGSVTGVVDELYILDDIESMSDLDGILERQLNKANYNLKSTEDLRVPSSALLESLCEDICRIDVSREDFRGIWKEVALPNIYADMNGITFHEINEMWLDHLYMHHEQIFKDMFIGFKESELEKKNLIEQLEEEMKPFQDLASMLIDIEEIEKNWGRGLEEIAEKNVYYSNFNSYFIMREVQILETHSEGLNDYEEQSLRDFFRLLSHELDIN
jgi:hypothetical protein